MADDNIFENDLELLRVAFSQPGAQQSAGGRPVFADWADVGNCVMWLEMFAAPHLFHGMRRMPPREHLLGIMDIYLAYVRHDGRYMEPQFEPVPYERREPLAKKLRALLENWMPPIISQDIIETARALLYAEGVDPPEGWEHVCPPDFRPEEHLRWPEGIPALCKASQDTPSE
jgi:hypothetical protein